MSRAEPFRDHGEQLRHAHGLSLLLAVSAPDRVRQCVFQRIITANVGSRTDSALFSCILFSQADAGQTVPKDRPNVYLMVVAGKGARHMVV